MPGSAFEEFRLEFRPDLIGRLADAGPYRSHDPGPLGAEPFHRPDCGLQNARDRPPPAGMRGGDHPGVGVGEQHRCAVRSQGRNDQPWCPSDQCIGPGQGAAWQRSIDDQRRRAMDLIEGLHLLARLLPERQGHAAAVLSHRGLIVA